MLLQVEFWPSMCLCCRPQRRLARDLPLWAPRFTLQLSMEIEAPFSNSSQVNSHKNDSPLPQLHHTGEADTQESFQFTLICNTVMLYWFLYGHFLCIFTICREVRVQGQLQQSTHAAGRKLVLHRQTPAEQVLASMQTWNLSKLLKDSPPDAQRHPSCKVLTLARQLPMLIFKKEYVENWVLLRLYNRNVANIWRGSNSFCKWSYSLQGANTVLQLISDTEFPYCSHVL